MDETQGLIIDSKRSKAHRSAVSNGRRLFALVGTDSRTATGRRFRDLIEMMTADLGGPDLLSEFQKQLIRRSATLSIMAEAVECDVVRDMAFDPLLYGMIADRLRRLCETLGLVRVPKDVVTLESYLAATVEPEPPPRPGYFKNGTPFFRKPGQDSPLVDPEPVVVE